jgi:hypothetical protein
MTVETLDHMMTYVIEAWMVCSGAYLGLVYLLSLKQRIQKAAVEQSTQNQAEVTQDLRVATVGEGSEADRLTAVAAVSQKYSKAINSESVSTAVTVTE